MRLKAMAVGTVITPLNRIMAVVVLMEGDMVRSLTTEMAIPTAVRSVDTVETLMVGTVEIPIRSLAMGLLVMVVAGRVILTASRVDMVIWGLMVTMVVKAVIPEAVSPTVKVEIMNLLTVVAMVAVIVKSLKATRVLELPITRRSQFTRSRSSHIKLGRVV